MKKIIIILLAISLILVLVACDMFNGGEPDLSTASGRLQHEGQSRSSGAGTFFNQFVENLDEERVADVLELAMLGTLATYEIYQRQSMDYGILVSFTEQEVIDIINDAIDGDADAIDEFKEIIAYFEDIAGLLNQYNGRFWIRVFSPEVEELLFRLHAPQAIVEIIDGIDAFS